MFSRHDLYKLLITVIDNNGQTYTDTSDGWFTIKNTLDCTDSDSTPESFSSNDPSLLVKGTTSSAGESKIDYCASLSKIIEHSCSQGYVFADEMTCPSGYSCADGACKQQQQQESLSPTIDLSADKNTAAIGEQIKISYKITDPDYVSGDLKYAISEGYIGQLQTSPTNTVQQGTVSKELSTTPFSKSGTWKYIVSVTDPQKLGASKAITITVSSVCTPGAKQCEGSNLKTCKADGSGWDTTACTNGCSATKLVCMNCVPNLKWCEGSYLKTCGSDGFGVSGTLCSNGCDATNKICKPAPQVCVDSDGGNDQYKKGTCTSSGIKAEDMCSRPNTLEETRCVVPPYGGESRCESMFIACPNGCQDGVCKQSGGITGTRSAKSCEFSWPQKIVYSDGSKKECSYIRSTTNKYAKPYCNYPKAQQGIAQCCQWTKSKSYYNCVAM